MDRNDRGPTHVVGARFRALAPARAALEALRDRLHDPDLDADVRPLGSTEYAAPAGPDALLGGHFPEDEAPTAIAVIEEEGGEVLFDAVGRAADQPRWDEAARTEPVDRRRERRTGPRRPQRIIATVARPTARGDARARILRIGRRHLVDPFAPGAARRLDHAARDRDRDAGRDRMSEAR